VSRQRIPLAMRVGFTLWMLFWAPNMLLVQGPQNFLWLCNAAMFLILYALWTDNRFILSSQAGTVVLVGLVWSLDLLVSLLAGAPVTGLTAYMFNPELAMSVRLSSLYHVGLPPLVLWALLRTGYDVRAWRLQCALGALLVVGSWVWTEPYRNVNWVYQPFGLEHPPLPVVAWVVVLLLAYPLIIYFPGHLLVRRLLAWLR
jgi:hypothetical protein